MKRTVIAVDIAKSVFEVGVSNHPGKVAESHRLSRKRFLRFFAERQPATVVMEACGSAHFWGRELRKLGHTVVLLPAHDVRPYVRRNKTDRTDTKGLLEAFRNEEIRPVPVKSVAQQTLTGLHRLRSGWVTSRTARINAVRGLLREQGITIRPGAWHVVPKVRELIADADSGIPDALREPLATACREIEELSERVEEATKQLEVLGAGSPVVARLQTIPGIGLLTATALVGFVGDVQRFASSRHFASYLGLTPREHSSGLRQSLGAISKRGDVYLRTLLVHGARSALFHSKRLKEPDALRRWALDLEERSCHNKAVVGLANKLARIVWAVWRNERDYESRVAA